MRASRAAVILSILIALLAPAAAGFQALDAVALFLGIPLLGVIVLLLPVIILSTVFQTSAGVSFTPGQIVGPIAGFAVLGVLAVWAAASVVPARADSPARV